MTSEPAAVKPDPQHIKFLINDYRDMRVPIFLKDNLNWPEKIREWPLLEVRARENLALVGGKQATLPGE